MDGYKLARQLRRHGFVKEPLLIAITGYADEAHRLRGMEAGLDQYLFKPVEPSVVEELLLLQQDRLAEMPENYQHQSAVAMKEACAAL
jgi:DNA-binding response OmpR family regulator